MAAAGGDEVIKVDVATDSIVGEYGADTGEGIAVTPSGSTLYIAQTGRGRADLQRGRPGHRLDRGSGVADVDRRHAGRVPGVGGNGYTGSISVISTAIGTVTDTISGGGQATALNSATTAIAFGPAAS